MVALGRTETERRRKCTSENRQGDIIVRGKEHESTNGRSIGHFLSKIISRQPTYINNGEVVAEKSRWRERKEDLIDNTIRLRPEVRRVEY